LSNSLFQEDVSGRSAKITVSSGPGSLARTQDCGVSGSQGFAGKSHLQEEAGELLKSVSIRTQDDTSIRIHVESVPNVFQARIGVLKIHGNSVCPESVSIACQLSRP
jgi:hypothetical protein